METLMQQSVMALLTILFGCAVAISATRMRLPTIEPVVSEPDALSPDDETYLSLLLFCM